MPASGQEKAALGAARGRPFRQPSSRARRSGGGAASEGARGSHALRMPKLARFVNHARAGSERAARHRTLKLHRGPGVRRRRLLSRPGRTAWSSARGRPCGAGRSPRPGRTRRTAVPLRSGWPRRTPVARRSGRSRRSRRTGRAGLPWGARRRHRREYGRSGAGGRRAGISLRARLSLRTGLTAPGDRRFARLGRCRKCHDAARRVINDPELEIPAPIGALDEAVVEPISTSLSAAWPITQRYPSAMRATAIEISAFAAAGRSTTDSAKPMRGPIRIIRPGAPALLVAAKLARARRAPNGFSLLEVASAPNPSHNCLR